MFALNFMLIRKQVMIELFEMIRRFLSCSFVLSMADVDPHLMMEDESLVWMSKDVVVVLQHLNEKIPLR